MGKYINKKVADLTFGIHPSALAVANLIGDFYYEIEDEHPGIFEDEFKEHFVNNLLEFKTFPFYNGREKAICIVMQSMYQSKALHIVFGENRNSDDIFIDSWVGPLDFNSPNVNDLTDETYKKRKYFGLRDVYKAVEHINVKLVDHVIALLFEEHKAFKKNKENQLKKEKVK
jgi:hypothetical protein